MTEEKKVETVVEEKKVELTPEGGVKPEQFAELQASLKEIREKFAGKDTENEAIKKELEQVKGATQIVDRLKKALGGEEAGDLEAQREKAAFYKLLVDNPVEAIRKVVAAEKVKTDQVVRERETEKQFGRFVKIYPEYKDYEEDMKAELLSNPGWFDKPNFIRRVFFDVLTSKNPELLQKILGEGREKGVTEGSEFVFEGASQTLHGSDQTTGATIMERMQKAAPPKSYFG